MSEVYVQIWLYQEDDALAPQLDGGRAAGVENVFCFYFNGWIPPAPPQLSSRYDLAFRVFGPAGPAWPGATHENHPVWLSVNEGRAQSFVAESNRVERVALYLESRRHTGGNRQPPGGVVAPPKRAERGLDPRQQPSDVLLCGAMNPRSGGIPACWLPEHPDLKMIADCRLPIADCLTRESSSSSTSSSTHFHRLWRRVGHRVRPENVVWPRMKHG
jgi:hypothetical protein